MAARRKKARRHEWLNLLEMNGLLVSEPVLCERFPEGLEHLPQNVYNYTLTAWDRLQADTSDPARMRSWLEQILFWVLDLPRERFRWARDIQQNLTVYLPEYDQTIEPRGVLVDSNDKPQMGLWTVPYSQQLDRIEKTRGRWRATPFVKAARWQRETDVPFCLLTNGRRFRLIYIPTGLPEVTIDFDATAWAEEKTTLDAFAMLLRRERWEGDITLKSLVLESEEKQAEISDTLGRQVRQAVEHLILALDREDFRLNNRLLGDVSAEEIYRASVYFVMRLVFVLFAEERSLLPHGNVFFDEAYGLGRLLHLLEREKRENENSYNEASDAFPRTGVRQ